ncbi:MAG: class I SAM-dependent methyltransferase [bacterium]
MDPFYQPIRFDVVADLYDIYVQVDFDLAFFLQETQSVRGNVLELGSGTGRLSIPLLRAGVSLTCVDYSPKMLDVLEQKLRQHNLSARVHKMDMAELSLTDRYQLIFIPFHSFAEVLERPRQQSTIERIYNHLTEGGEFICTLHNPIIRQKSLDGALKLLREYPLASGGSLIVRYQMQYDAASRIAHGHQFYERYDAKKNLVDARTLDVNFYLFSKQDFEEMVYSTGFKLAALYGNYDHSGFDETTSPFMIWKLKRSSS